MVRYPVWYSIASTTRSSISNEVKIVSVTHNDSISGRKKLLLAFINLRRKVGVPVSAFVLRLA